ncbi:MAG: molecular chaperone HtpG [Clostridiales Family XIII bacterium]|jgi:molecular chaperone HtpG|nr:molecular chaperone HtpG [Clostridiales Family XIII bacterium]
MAKKQFKAESKRLLDLMINSIYTHKEIFLRELISNASDAIDKLYYKSLVEQASGVSKDDFSIWISIDKTDRTLTISDNGIGMTRDELESNLGTIAKSGSLDFKEAVDEGAAPDKVQTAKDAIDIIGQFGVGFYSAFMVSSKVRVISRAYGEETAWEWESNGAEGYTVKESERGGNGTEIILTIKESTDDEKFDEYLEVYRIRSLIKRYSDYIRYPIMTNVEKSRQVQEAEIENEEGDEAEKREPIFETYIEAETLNSMTPIWKRGKNEIGDEEYNEYYREKFGDYTSPMKVIHTSVEGVVSYDALLFIPAKAPYNYYSKEYEKGLQLYSSGVMIMEKCADLLPDYFSFVKGLVDSQDLSLNISREMLQHDRQLKGIASRLESKIKSELLALLNTDREKYEEFFKAFGLQIKFGIYDNFGMKKENLQDLIMFHSSKEKKLVTLSEYVSRMDAEQKFIYFAAGETVEKLDNLPQTELLKDKGIEILYLTDDVDEFVLRVMNEYKEKQFKSISEGDLGIEESEEEKKAAEEKAESNKDMIAAVKEALGEKVTEVKLSRRLKSHPVCLASGEGFSLEMEKVLAAMPMNEGVKAERILEINSEHPVFEALKAAFEKDREKIKTYAGLLYDQALLIEGLPIEDPVAFSNAICELMSEKTAVE